MKTISFESHGTSCAAWYVDAESDELNTSRGRPCVVMAHGFGATRDAGLLPFAERFATAGLDVLVFGDPGSAAVIAFHGAAQGYEAIMGPTVRNEMCARGALRIGLNRPVTSAGKLTMPILLIVAEQDNVAPVAAVRAVAQRAGALAQTDSFACGHFDIYVGEVFEKSVARQVEFLLTTLR